MAFIFEVSPPSLPTIAATAISKISATKSGASGGGDDGGDDGGDGGGGRDGVVPRVSTTLVITATEKEEEVLIKIYDCIIKKPFLGGYKHKMNGMEYHHASAQTHPKPRLLPQVSIGMIITSHDRKILYLKELGW